MSLTELQIRNASQAEKPFKLADGRGLFLLVRPNGSKLFRFRYRHGGKQHDLSVGAYPRISLKEARTLADEARKLVTQGIDPRHAKKAEKRKRLVQAANTFEAVAREFVANRAPRRSDAYEGYTLRRRSARARSAKSSLRNCSRLCGKSKLGALPKWRIGSA